MTTSYQGLSRTYRPQSFFDVLNQEAIVTTLKNALQTKKTAQAYLFCGTRGTGKTTLARVLAKALNCQNLSANSEPCNACPSCIEITQGKSLQVLEIDGASNRGIDDIRQLNDSVNYTLRADGYKVFIIDEAHMLTKEAFNALLKTLEEPPPNVKFFLATTEPHKVPATVISRCQRFNLQRISALNILQKLQFIAKTQGLSFEETALYRIADLADGSLRVAESLLDQVLCFIQGPLTLSGVEQALSLVSQDSFFALDEAFSSYKLSFAFELAQKIFSSGKDLSYFFECLLEHYRTIAALQMKVALNEMPSSLQEQYKRSSSLYTEEQSLYILDYLMNWHQQTQRSSLKRIALEMILLHIVKSRHRIFAGDLILRMEALQRSPIQEVQGPLKEESAPKVPVVLQTLDQKVQEPEPKKKTLQRPIQEVQETPKEAPLLTKELQIKCDTFVRFACIELEGSVVKK